MAAKLDELQQRGMPAAASDAMPVIVEHAEFATTILNRLFGANIETPSIVLLDERVKNAYWGPNTSNIHVPPQAKDLPDIIYHEVSWAFITSVANLFYFSQSGSLMESYADVLTSVVKQERLNQTVEQADWIIAPGAIAWIRGQKPISSTDRSPLRSLKDPGSAYDDPVIGKDPQVNHMKNFVYTSADNGGVRVNSGIPNKAFYIASTEIGINGTHKAAEIWVEGLKKMKPSTDFHDAAMILRDVARDKYGDNSNELMAVDKAWSEVGIPAEPT